MNKSSNQSEVKILLIEDDLSWRDYIKEILNNPNYHFEEVATHKQARKKLDERRETNSNNQFDLLIIDLDLPDFKSELIPDLLNVLRRVIVSLSKDQTQPFEKIPLVVLTGHTLDKSQILLAFNEFSGWIWGWFEKNQLNQDRLIDNVYSAIKFQKEYKLLLETRISNQANKSVNKIVLRGVIVAIIIYFLWLALILYSIFFISWNLIEPWVYVIGTILPNVLILIFQSYYLFKKGKIPSGSSWPDYLSEHYNAQNQDEK